MDEKEYVPIYFKDLFKTIFSDESDLEPLKYLIKQILDVEVNDIKIIKDKISRDRLLNLYAYAETDDGLIHNFMFTTDNLFVDLKESFLILCEAIGDDYGKYLDYTNLRYHIVNFNFGNIKEVAPVSNYALASKSDPEDKYETFEIKDIDLPYYEKKYLNKESENELEKLLGIIGLTKQIDITEDNKVLNKIIKKANDYRNGEKLISNYKKYKYDYDRIQDEVDISIRHKMEDIIDKMEEKNISVEDISDITSLSIKEINKIKSNRTLI